MEYDLPNVLFEPHSIALALGLKSTIESSVKRLVCCLAEVAICLIPNC